jgi:Family of unknown function (DUF6920)
MRYVLAGLCVIHGFAHVVGLVVPWRLVTVAEQPYRTTVLQGRIDLGDWGIRLYGLGWLVLALCFLIAAIGIMFRSSWWLAWLEAVCVVSVIFCALSWPDARIGIPANILVLTLAFAAVRYEPAGLAIKDSSLEDLWNSIASRNEERSDPSLVSAVPLPARVYLTHAIDPGARTVSSVRLRMHGEIKIGGWRSFHAEQVLSRDGSFIWAAIVSMYGFPIRGSDRLMNGQGFMGWKLLDIVPVMTGSGKDITRSAIGRLQGELVAWLPSALFGDNASWTGGEPEHPRVRVKVLGESAEIELETDGSGALKTLRMRRWGNPDGGEPRYIDFGVIVEEERKFDGFTVPSRIRAGWFFGTDRYESEGEFFRASIDSAEYK